MASLLPSANTETQSRFKTALQFIGGHSKTLLAGGAAAGFLGFAAYATYKVKQLNKKIKNSAGAQRTALMKLRASQENWVFLRNVAYAVSVGAGVLATWGVAHHAAKGAAWTQKDSSLAKACAWLLGVTPPAAPGDKSAAASRRQSDANKASVPGAAGGDKPGHDAPVAGTAAGTGDAGTPVSPVATPTDGAGTPVLDPQPDLHTAAPDTAASAPDASADGAPADGASADGAPAAGTQDAPAAPATAAGQTGEQND
jgi:hypothetical protein